LMRINAKAVSIVVLLAAAVWMQAVVTRNPGAPGFPGKAREAVPGAERLAARWAAEYAERDLSARTPIHLGFSRAFSKHFTKASAMVLLDFEAGRVTVAVKELGPLPENATYELWLVEQRTSTTSRTSWRRSAADRAVLTCRSSLVACGGRPLSQTGSRRGCALTTGTTVDECGHI